MHAAPILVIDDDPDIRESLGDMLSHEGYDVQTAQSGSTALELAKAEHYAAVLLDIQLPDIDGLSVLKVLMELDPDLPIIIVTGNATTENTVGSLSKGAFAYLTKPYNSQELKAVVRRAVSMKGLVDRAEQVEHALYASEARFRALVESATDAIILADQSGHMIWWNGAAERMFGYAKHDALGHSLGLIMPERYRIPHGSGLKRITEGEPGKLLGRTAELVGRNKDGREFPIELSLASWRTAEGTFFSGMIRDISQRKQAEEAILRLSHRNALILDSAAEGIFGMDQAGKITFINLTGARLLGASAEELIGCQVWPFVRSAGPPNESGELPALPLYSALRDGTVHRIQNDEFLRLDGQTLPVEYVTSPIREQGRVVGAVVVFQDISERKRAEERQHAQLAVSHILAQSDHLEAALPALLPVIAELGAWDLVLFWQRASSQSPLSCIATWTRPTHDLADFVSLCRRTTFPSGLDLPGSAIRGGLPLWISDVLSAPQFTRTPTASRLGLHTACAIPIVTVEGPDAVLELFAEDARKADGAVLQTLIDTGMKLGQFLNRAKAGQAVRASHEMIQGLLTNLPIAMLLCDRHQRIQYANALAHEYFSSSCGTLSGRMIKDALDFRQETRQQLTEVWSSLCAEDKATSPEQECKLGTRVFRYRLFAVPASPDVDPQVGILLWDITEHQQLQEQLAQAEKLSSLGTLVSGMAHEINNPAQAILSMAELIQDENDPAAIREFATDIVQYARHVSTVVRDFASYARSSSRDADTEVDLAERLLEAVKMVRRAPYFGYIDVVTEFKNPALLLARKGEIDQVFVNLIGNAAQAMNGAGRLTLSTCLVDSRIEVSIADTGSGIPTQILPRIFDPFFTTKEPGKGTGLGLSIVHKIVTKYEGRITVESEEGRGTTFRLQFPSLPETGGAS